MLFADSLQMSEEIRRVANKVKAINVVNGVLESDGKSYFYPLRWISRDMATILIDNTNRQIRSATITATAISKEIYGSNSQLSINANLFNVGTSSTVKVYGIARIGAQFFSRNSFGNWLPIDSANLNSTPAAAQVADNSRVNIIDNVNLSAFPGLEIFVGYGSSFMDMITGGKFKLVHTVYSD